MFRSKVIVLVLIVSLLISASVADACSIRKQGSRDVFKPYRIYRNYVGCSIVDDMDPEDWEIGICGTRWGPFPIKFICPGNWINGAANYFILTFTTETGELTFTIGNKPTVSHVFEEYAGKGMNEIHVAANSFSNWTDFWTFTFITDLKVNGIDYDLDDVIGDGTYTYATITGLNCEDFELTGYVHANWIGMLMSKKVQAFFRLGEPCEDPNDDIQVGPTSDISGDCAVDMRDFAYMATHWLEICDEPNWCGGNDFGHDQIVDPNDLAVLLEEWLIKKYGGGCGTEEVPYLIYTAEHLNAIGANPDDWGAHFKLMANIDLSDYPGNAFNTIGTEEQPFTGVFEGNYYEIYNFSQGELEEEVLGMFRYVDDPSALIMNLWLTNPILATEGPNYAGALVGKLEQGTLFRCFVEGGEVAGYGGLAETTGANYVGGLVGYNAGTILECSANCEVSGYDFAGGLVGYNIGTIESSYAEGPTIAGHDKVGGLIGYNVDGTIINSYAQKDVFAHDQVGGLIGQSDNGIVQYSYSTGHITENSDDRGGFLGELVGDDVVSCFWDITTGGELNDNGVGTPLSTLEMQMQETFTNASWDFSTPIWAIHELNDYPVLWWMVSPYPDPMSWKSEPEATGPYSIIMTGTTAMAFDGGGVEYYFQNMTDPAHDSGWQDSTTYEDTGLLSEAEYTYRVKVRGAESGYFEGVYSIPASATTLADTEIPQPNPMLWNIPPYGSDVHAMSMSSATASDEGPVEYYFNNITDPNHDSGWQDSPIYVDEGLDELTSYTYRVQARDKSPNQNTTGWSTDETGMTLDGTPPTPDPATWESVPSAIDPYTIGMTASTASDINGVEYYFYNITDPAHDSGWQDSATYEDNGLDPNTEYTYQVNARDTSSNNNETGYSDPASATTPDDVSTPQPDPMTWEVPPTMHGEHSITMTATTATDEGEVEYYFYNVTDPTHDSGWQDSATYLDTGLALDSEYTYQVKARDKSPNLNETGYSDPASARTDVDRTPPQPDPMTWSAVPALNGPYSAIMTASGATDESGYEYYFHNVTDPNHDSGWQDSASYEDPCLAPETMYTYQVKARDKSPQQNETAYSGAASIQTESATPRVQVVETFLPVASEDGRIFNDNKGDVGLSSDDATNMALRLGDYGKYGYKSILSFDTSDIPEDSIIESVYLEITRGDKPALAEDPFIWGGSCNIDIISGHFGASSALGIDDWDAPGSTAIATFAGPDPGEDTPITSTAFNATGMDNINLEGKTQLRVYFTERINDPCDVDVDFLGFYSGEYENSDYRPKLIITYNTRSPLAIFNSTPEYDGRMWDKNGVVADGGVESNNTSSLDRSIRLGDVYLTTGNYTYRNIVSFDTSSLPDTSVILSAKLQMTRGYFGPDLEVPIEAVDPFEWGGTCVIDVAAPYFGSSVNLALEDWNASADVTNGATFTADPGLEQPMISTEFNAASLNIINVTGTTQFRVYFTIPTNNDTFSDFLGFYPGEYITLEELKVPKLIIRYQIF
ncbi:MAG: hypothetical protein JW860_06920 [Sedimentisphaerales bacterium]|nr:hypothetical protein [Sedimentisphaerales bacterium]